MASHIHEVSLPKTPPPTKVKYNMINLSMCKERAILVGYSVDSGDSISVTETVVEKSTQFTTYSVLIQEIPPRLQYGLRKIKVPGLRFDSPVIRTVPYCVLGLSCIRNVTVPGSMLHTRSMERAIAWSRMILYEASGQRWYSNAMVRNIGLRLLEYGGGSVLY